MSYMPGMSTKGILKRKSIIEKTSEGLFTVIEKKLTNAKFHTSRGYREVDVTLVTVLVEGRLGSIEVIVSTTMNMAIRLVNEIIKENIAFEDIETVLELKADYKRIDMAVEKRLEEIEPKEVAEELAVFEDMDVQIYKRTHARLYTKK